MSGKEVAATVWKAEKDPVVVALCEEASKTAKGLVALLFAKITEHIRAPVSEEGKV